MDLSQKIRIAQVKRDNMSDAELARKCGWSSQNLYDKHKKDIWRVADLRKIAEALESDVDITFKDKKTGEEL